MKKFISIFLALCMVALFSGCGQGQSSTQAAPSESVQSESVSSKTQEVISNPSSENTTPQEETDSTQSQAMDSAESQSTDAATSNILIAYFSWSGNTEQIAKEIQEQTGGELFKIVPADPYSSDFDETADRWHEERDADARPEITGTVDTMENYDYVFLGYPIWSSDLPAVNRTFLEQYDISGKTIIPFCTHGGSAFGNSVNRIKSLAPDVTILDGYETRGENASNCANEIAEWLEELGIIQ